MIFTHLSVITPILQWLTLNLISQIIKVHLTIRYLNLDDNKRLVGHKNELHSMVFNIDEKVEIIT